MDVHLNFNEVMKFNDDRIKREEEETIKSCFMSREMRDKLKNHYADIRRSRGYLTGLLKNHSFIENLLKKQGRVNNNDISVFFNRDGNPEIKTYEELAEFRFKEEIKNNGKSGVDVFKKLLCSVISVEEQIYILREVITDKEGDMYLMEIGLMSLMIDLLDGFKDVSAESLFINSRLKPIKNKNKYERLCGEISISLLTNESISCIYNVRLFKLGVGAYKDYILYDRVLRKQGLNDDDLIALFNPVEKTKNKHKNKNKNIVKTEKVVDVVKNEVVEDEVVKNEVVDDEYNSSDGYSSSDSSDNSGYSDDETPIKIFNLKFNHSIDLNERNDILNMIYNLYDNNEVFNQFINTNKYNKIKIIKGFHYDKNNTINSLHITAVFYNGETFTKPYHLYIRDDAIISITVLNSLF